MQRRALGKAYAFSSKRAVLLAVGAALAASCGVPDDEGEPVASSRAVRDVLGGKPSTVNTRFDSDNTVSEAMLSIAARAEPTFELGGSASEPMAGGQAAKRNVVRTAAPRRVADTAAPSDSALVGRVERALPILLMTLWTASLLLRRYRERLRALFQLRGRSCLGHGP